MLTTSGVHRIHNYQIRRWMGEKKFCILDWNILFFIGLLTGWRDQCRGLPYKLGWIQESLVDGSALNEEEECKISRSLCDSFTTSRVNCRASAALLARS